MAGASVALMACGAPSHPEASPLQQPEPASSGSSVASPPTASLSIDFDRLRRDGAASGLPVVELTMAGRPVLAILDTGAGASVVDREFARAAGLDAKEGAAQANATGARSVAAGRLDDVLLGIGAIGEVRSTFFVLDLPEPLRARGVSMVVSPQQLSRAGLLLDVDLARGVLQASVEVAPRSDDLALVRCEAGGGENVHYVLQGRVDGRAATLMLDTGATRGSVLRESALGSALSARVAGRREVVGAAGSVSVDQLPGVQVELAGKQWVLDLDLEDGSVDPACPYEASIGIDALRHFRLRLGRDGAFLR